MTTRGGHFDCRVSTCAGCRRLCAVIFVYLVAHEAMLSVGSSIYTKKSGDLSFDHDELFAQSEARDFTDGDTAPSRHLLRLLAERSGTGRDAKVDDRVLALNLAALEHGDLGSSSKRRRIDPEERRLGGSRAGQLARRLKELLTTARSFLTVAEDYQDEELAALIRVQIASCRVLLESASQDVLAAGDEVSLQLVQNQVDAMELLVARLREQPFDTTSLITRLRLKLEMIEKHTSAVNLQSKLYSQMAAKAIPQGLHCLAMRLTMEHNRRPELQKHEFGSGPKLTDPTLHHYALFSDNVLAVAVVVNSTAQNLLDPAAHVFHIVTDRMNYAAMRAWFALNLPPGLTLDIKCLDEYEWITPAYVPVLRQIELEGMKRFYFRSAVADGEAADRDDYTNLKYRNPKYLSILNHLRFYLPQIFPHLDKVLFLDDDVVVQKDLSLLWKVPMHGAVNLAVETCGESFHRFWTYLNFSSPLLAGGPYRRQDCAWAFGMNLFDLTVWRAGEYTAVYHHWQRQNENRTLWRLGTLPAGLLTFYNATQALDRSWQVLGLGSTGNVSLEAIRSAAVIHYNGHAKPWLELAILNYQPFWARYVPYHNDLLKACFITPD